MNQQTFALVLGAVLSFLFEYIPGFNSWFSGLDATQKRLFMLILCVAVGGLVVMVSCYTPYAVIECSNDGVQALVEIVLLSIISNQGIHRIIKR